jgi:hypothetical protein
LEANQPKQLCPDFGRNLANGRVNYSIQLEDVAGRYLFSLDADSRKKKPKIKTPPVFQVDSPGQQAGFAKEISSFKPGAPRMG